MVTLSRPQRLNLNLPLAPTAAVAGGVLIALSCLVMPAGLLERLVATSGLPAVVAAAEPPLGMTARIALALLLGGGFAGFSWLGIELLAGDRSLTVGRALALFRRSDIHPDAPPRPPLFAARDLGTPFLDVRAPTPPVLERDRESVLELAEPMAPPAEQPLPADLDQPMAAFDPDALLESPLPPPEPVAALARPSLIDPGDRFETFELTPVARNTPSLLAEPAAPETPAPRSEPVIGPETEATVHDLLARLERGLAKPATSENPLNTLSDTLGDLRRMATAAR